MRIFISSLSTTFPIILLLLLLDWVTTKVILIFWITNWTPVKLKNFGFFCRGFLALIIHDLFLYELLKTACMECMILYGCQTAIKNLYLLLLLAF